MFSLRGRRGGQPLGYALLVMLFAAGCGEEDPDACYDTTPGEHMRVGENCLSCHQPGFGDEAPTWTAAGTVFESADAHLCDGVEGAVVVLQGADGEEVRLTTNEVGNFWTDEELVEEGYAYMEYQGRTMTMGRTLPKVPACNACHSIPSVGDAPGRLYVP